MPDPIQAGSASPIPSHQTLQATRDPLPVSSPRAIARADTALLDTQAARSQDDFKAYLDQSSITTQERQQKKTQLDPADEIARQNVYQQQGTVPL